MPKYITKDVKDIKNLLKKRKTKGNKIIEKEVTF